MNKKMEDKHKDCPHPNTPDWNDVCRRVMSGELPNTGVYEDLSLKTIHLLYNQFADHGKVDFIRVLESLAYGFFCTLASQIKDNPRFTNKLDTHMIDMMVKATVNGVGEILASEGIAMPRVARSTMP